MDIIVFMKQTFDTEENICIQDGQIVEDDVKRIINPYDEFAIEEAVRIKEETDDAEVTVVTLGRECAEEALRTALAMGADKGIHIVAEDGFVADEYRTARILASVVRDLHYDLILAGNMAVDDGSAQVGPRVAEELGIAHVASVVKLTIGKDRVEIEREAESGKEVLESALPLLITAQQGLNEPRYPSLQNVMKAKRKPVQKIPVAETAAGTNELADKTVVVNCFLPPEKKAGRKLEGTLPEQARELVRILCDEEKVV